MTVPATTLLPDELAFLNSIRDEPDNDTVRLAYADWLDGQDTVSVKCRECDGKGERRLAGYLCHCHTCDDTGFVLDTTHADRAELIRVQVELTNWNGCGCGGSIKPCRGCQLRSRESAILATHPDWLPPCPTKETRCRMNGYCPANSCSGTGRIGSFVRGMVELEVPTLATLFEEVLAVDCRTCGQPAGDKHNPHCSAVRKMKWQLTGYGRTLRDEFPHVVSVRVRDRVPLEIRITKRWLWHAIRNEEAAHIVPKFLVDMMPNQGPNHPQEPMKGFGTPELATAALGNAVARAIFSEAMK